jgi:hypothetical protein
MEVAESPAALYAATPSTPPWLTTAGPLHDVDPAGARGERAGARRAPRVAGQFRPVGHRIIDALVRPTA